MLVWRRGLSAGLQTEGSEVQFQIEQEGGRQEVEEDEGGKRKYSSLQYVT